MASGTGGGRDRRAQGGAELGTGRVVFLVIAAAAPMAAITGDVPLTIRYGDGAGLPAVQLIASAVLLCFSVGYAAMSRRVVHTGAFHTHIARALGKPATVAAAYGAVVACPALTIGTAGAFGYFSSLVLASFGVGLPWYLCSAVSLLPVAILGYRSVDLSARVLGSLIAAEFGVLVVFDALAIGHRVKPPSRPPRSPVRTCCPDRSGSR